MGFMYNIGSQGIFDVTIDLLNDDIVVLLLNNTYVPSQDHQYISQLVTSEISGLGYVRRELTNKRFVRDDARDITMFDADNPFYLQIAVGEIASAVIAKNTGDEETSPLIAFLDDGLPYMTDGTDFVLQWSPDGIMVLGSASVGGIGGPTSSTDDAIVRWNGTLGDKIKDSTVTIDDTGAFFGGTFSGGEISSPRNTIQIRYGDDTERTDTPAIGELLIAMDTEMLYVGDGTTVGGIPLATCELVDGAVVPAALHKHSELYRLDGTQPIIIGRNTGHLSIGTLSDSELLTTSGAIVLGAAVGTENGTIQYTGTDLVVRLDDAWVSLTGIGHLTGAGVPDRIALWSASDPQGVTYSDKLQYNATLGILGLAGPSGGPAILPVDMIELWEQDRDGLADKGGLVIRAEDGTVYMLSDRMGIGTLVPAETLDVVGGIKIGSAVGSNDGTIRWNGSDFEGRKSGAWVSFTETTSTVVTGRWTWSTDTSGVVTAGHAAGNNADLIAITELAIAKANADGADYSSYFLSMRTGDVIFIYDPAAPLRYARFHLSAPPDSTDPVYVTIPVVNFVAGSMMANNTSVRIALSMSAGSGGSGGVGTINTYSFWQAADTLGSDTILVRDADNYRLGVFQPSPTAMVDIGNASQHGTIRLNTTGGGLTIDAGAGQSDKTVTFVDPGANDTVAYVTMAQSLVNKTINGVTLTSTATGFTVSGGTAPKTLTMDADLVATTPLGIVGSANRIVVGGGTTLSAGGVVGTVDISPSYVGQASLTTLGTITTGVWHGSVVEPTYGGTGLSTYIKGDMVVATNTNVLGTVPANQTTVRKFLRQVGNGTVAQDPIWDVLTVADMPAGFTPDSGGGITGTFMHMGA